MNARIEIRLEIASYDKLVFVGEFPSLAASQNFSSWWSRQPILPQGGAVHQRTDLPPMWPDLPKMELTAKQRKLIELRQQGIL